MSLAYSVLLTGDCSNIGAGAIDLYPTGGTAPYTVDWYSPSLGVDTTVYTSSTRTTLTAGTYQVLITDSTSPTNETLYVNITVSSGNCATIGTVVSTTCGLSNGSAEILTSSACTPITFALYDLSGNSISTATTYSTSYTFNALSAGTYYVETLDCGGCSGFTGTIVVKPSIDLTYGLFNVNNSPCVGTSNGAIYITGLTGTPPYTYTWSTGAVTQNITGLTNGSYSVTVTDSGGCSLSLNTTITTADVLGVAGFVSISPTCFNSDGELDVTISGGTPPYYYSLSNGQNDVLYATNIIYTGLPAGTYTITVTDAALCTASGMTSLDTPGAFASVSVSKQNSVCSINGGSILVTASGGYTPVTFSLTDSLSNTTTFVGGPSYNFTGLTSGNYTLTVSNGSSCTYTEVITILNTTPFNLSVSTTGTTCNNTNGSALISVDTPGLYTYQVGSQIYSNTTSQSILFTNLASGYYTASVADASTTTLPCIQTINFYISPSNSISYAFDTTDCGGGSDGTLTVLIASGVPPYTFNWTPSLAPQTGVFYTGLTAGTYTLELIDSTGCSLTQSTTITCPTTQTNYSIFNICDTIFNGYTNTKLNIPKMVYQGFEEVTLDGNNCYVTGMSFTVYIDVDGNTYSDNFYTSLSLNDYPTDTLFVSTITNILLTIPGIASADVDITNNNITINADCTNSLADKLVTIQLEVAYDYCCN
jgi:hypothetical protein